MRNWLLCHKVVCKNEFILPGHCYMIPEKDYIIHTLDERHLALLMGAFVCIEQ